MRGDPGRWHGVLGHARAGLLPRSCSHWHSHQNLRSLARVARSRAAKLMLLDAVGAPAVVSRSRSQSTSRLSCACGRAIACLTTAAAATATAAAAQHSTLCLLSCTSAAMSKTLRLPPPPAKRQRLAAGPGAPAAAPLAAAATARAPPPPAAAHALNGSRHEADADDDLAVEADVDLALPNDTLAALHLLRSRFPAEVRSVREDLWRHWMPQPQQAAAALGATDIGGKQLHPGSAARAELLLLPCFCRRPRWRPLPPRRSCTQC